MPKSAAVLFASWTIATSCSSVLSAFLVPDTTRQHTGRGRALFDASDQLCRFTNCNLLLSLFLRLIFLGKPSIKRRNKRQVVEASLRTPLSLPSPLDFLLFFFLATRSVSSVYLHSPRRYSTLVIILFTFCSLLTLGPPDHRQFICDCKTTSIRLDFSGSPGLRGQSATYTPGIIVLGSSCHPVGYIRHWMHRLCGSSSIYAYLVSAPSFSFFLFFIFLSSSLSSSVRCLYLLAPWPGTKYLHFHNKLHANIYLCLFVQLAAPDIYDRTCPIPLPRTLHVSQIRTRTQPSTSTTT